MKMILWPVIDGDGNLRMPAQWRADDCLRFHPDGLIESNGGPVGHEEITEEQLKLLPQADRQFVRDFLAGNHSV